MTFAIAVCLILTLVASTAILPVWFKISALSLAGVALLALFLSWIGSPLREGDIESTAAHFEGAFGKLKGRLVAATQFASRPDSIAPGTSPELVELTAKQTLEMTRDLNLSHALNKSQLRKSLSPAFVGVAVFAIVALVFPSYVTHAVNVYSQPTVEVAPPLGYNLVSFPDSGKAIKYRDLEIGGIIKGDGFPKSATIHYRFSEGNWRKVKIDLSDLTSSKPGLSETKSADSLVFTTRLREVKRSLEVYVEAGRAKSEPIHIEIVDLPRVTGIAITISPPEYTGLPQIKIDENDGSFSALVGSRASLRIESSADLNLAQLEFQNGDLVSLNVSGRSLKTDLVVEEFRSYVVRLTDELGEENPDPIEYYITAIPDENPQVSVINPGTDIDLDESLLIPLLAHISDDFGFSSLALKYHIKSSRGESDEKVVILHFSDNIKIEGDIEFSWNVGKLGLEPGDFISYYLEVQDNDNINGPKIGKSPVFYARLPSIDELIAELSGEYEERIEDTRELLEKEKQLLERFKDASRKLQAEITEKKMDWQKKKSLEDLLNKSQEFSGQLDDLAKQMEEAISRQENDRLMTQEMIEKLKRIQELYSEVATQEMLDAQKKLEEALKSMDPQELQDAMDQFEESMEEMIERLDRTLSLLERMKLEQMINSMVEAAKEILDRQMANNDRTAESPAEKLPGLADEEDKLQKALDNLKKQAGEFLDELQDSDMSESKDAKDFANAALDSDAGEDMEDMSSSLRGENKDGSTKSGESAESKLQAMLDKMREKQQAMSGDQSDKMNAELRRVINDANYLSRNQERMYDETGELGPRSTALRELAGEQMTLMEAVTGFGQRLMSLSKQNPFLSSEWRTTIKDALRSMDNAVERMNETRGSVATSNQRDAVSKLNDIALQLLESMDQQKQCNSASSCDKAGQKMEKLGEQQKKLNRDSKGFCKNPGSGEKPSLTPGESEKLRELAGRQESIRKSLKELEAEFGNRQELLGDLDAMAKEMEKVVEELSSGQAGEETYERQVRIYSRMLQSTKALNRRDFTQERQARVGSDFLRKSPPGLSDGLSNQAPFEDRLQEFLKEGYPPEYERQIRDYFKALNKSSTGKEANGSGK